MVLSVLPSRRQLRAQLARGAAREQRGRARRLRGAPPAAWPTRAAAMRCLLLLVSPLRTAPLLLLLSCAPPLGVLLLLLAGGERLCCRRRRRRAPTLLHGSCRWEGNAAARAVAAVCVVPA